MVLSKSQSTKTNYAQINGWMILSDYFALVHFITATVLSIYSAYELIESKILFLEILYRDNIINNMFEWGWGNE